MAYVAKIIDAFGGLRPMAKAIEKPVSTVQSWKVRGSIPDASKPEILAKAKAAGIPLSPGDFFPVSDNGRGAA